MPRKNSDLLRVNLDPSSDAMLAEHERLAALYLYNAEMGEKRTSHYLTVISAATAVLFGLAQLYRDQALILGPAIGLLTGVLVFGLVTFNRLIERRLRGTEYLRAINRIHRYFADLDPALEPHYFWPCCDDVPTFHGSGAALTGLRDVVGTLNSLFAGMLAVVLEMALWAGAPPALLGLSGLAAGGLVWLWHQRYETRHLTMAEEDAAAYVCFPRGKGQGA